MKKIKILFCFLSLYGGHISLGLSAEEKKYTESEFNKLLKTKLEEELKKAMQKVGKGSLVDLSNELLKKEEDLKLKDLELAKLKEQIDKGSSDFELKVKKFQEEEAKVLGCIGAHEQEKQKRVTHMVDTISSMKPNVAAQVLSVQDPDISVRILGLLDPLKVSKIFNLMEKEISARLQKQYLDMKK